MEPIQIMFALVGLIGFVIPIFFIIGQDSESAVTDPSLEEMERRRQRENE
ncbi:hypothetical protein [Halapricum hydrolyticum]|uniref:Uncharacterized protein n=1 Tax=Halapricum hydrolyticum TaxID=2979991 RepID=A0AAE3IDA3_9EURY|nr:hypothetical protein [Halapricum hydrolyticum]MCU4718582.1 hypothetical protein [Halapricum hydrolyticum]MCU4727569.1 hypothetical protein [Halapricum hydrolyticum]